MSAQRIQLRRVKGWRKPENAIVVARPSRYGNPWTIKRHHGSWWVYLGQRCCWTGTLLSSRSEARAAAVRFYRSWLIRGRVVGHTQPMMRALSLVRDDILLRAPMLAGHDLACWCPLDEPCHADVLLEIANR